MAESEEMMSRGTARFASADEVFAELEEVHGSPCPGLAAWTWQGVEPARCQTSTLPFVPSPSTRRWRSPLDSAEGAQPPSATSGWCSQSCRGRAGGGRGRALRLLLLRHATPGAGAGLASTRQGRQSRAVPTPPCHRRCLLPHIIPRRNPASSWPKLAAVRNQWAASSWSRSTPTPS